MQDLLHFLIGEENVGQEADGAGLLGGKDEQPLSGGGGAVDHNGHNGHQKGRNKNDREYNYQQRPTGNAKNATGEIAFFLLTQMDLLTLCDV